ncbi:MAG: CTP synthase [Candidatus Coatesbacteria bacterium]|nr:CTP synthase [Candidatus Coatesbacteria bacterium]
MQTRYIFVLGGVVSSLGKGIASASIAMLLSRMGLSVTLQKFDPYINIDPGTMNPYQHGEVFVTSDGGETDLDLGYYERFTGINMTKNNNTTAGQVYNTIIEKERKGEFLGDTIQVIPHITDEIKRKVKFVGTGFDVVVTEIGGTVGDIESLPFLEAIRQLALDLGRENVLYILVTLVPYIESAGEIKTKPTQHSVHRIREIGIQPDIIICRSEKHISDEIKDKISLFCNVQKDCVIEAPNVENIYEVPIIFAEQKLHYIITGKMSIDPNSDLEISDWNTLVKHANEINSVVKIAIAGKYTKLKDAYKSVLAAITHASWANDVKPEIIWTESDSLVENPDLLDEADAVLVPGGFGLRGMEGKVAAAKYARENKIPYLGLCLGLHAATISFSRDICKLEGAQSTEFDKKTPHPVIDLLPQQKDLKKMGGTMRLGHYACLLFSGTKSLDLYGTNIVYERHRHRFEVNSKYIDILKKNGLVVAGINPDTKLVEIIEIHDHPFYIATQFHPEFQSNPLKPHPLFKGFIRAAKERSNERKR